MSNYKDKTVAVMGLSERTGLAVIEKMIELGADIIVSDIKEAKELKSELSVLRKYDDISYDLGGHTEQILKADMIVISPGVPHDLDILIKAEKEGIEVISEVELAYRLTEAKIIGVTGTNGKTTVTSLIGHILKNSLETKVRIGGNIGFPLISTVDGLTSKDWLVAELSSFQLEKIRKFRPNIAIMINFSPDHLDRHKTVKKYWNAKYNIFINQKKDDIVILNIDDKYIKDKLNNIKAKRYEISKKQVVENGIFYSQDHIYEVKDGKKVKVIKTSDIPLIGTHNILNTSIAVQTAKLFSIDNEIIKKYVKSYKAFAHRLEIIEDKDYTIIDDSKATNPHATINALRSIEKPIVLILGGQ
ncbi:MAG: UDP-N-acetylmuramoyl-L-alanine--D-glutamate ligase, partial [Halanaerobiales bacterium]|nr:UDP-N-acetylmuramoyl-L-alanine--D-glutamate ligase [Halanaerobiales bacterium]